ncbi:MAG: hypothetical protein IPM25_17460 [Chloracidobacterium sp.]|nr:hypothetical protein [Chloracidobacterium sp.]
MLTFGIFCLKWRHVTAKRREWLSKGEILQDRCHTESLIHSPGRVHRFLAPIAVRFTADLTEIVSSPDPPKL